MSTTKHPYAPGSGGLVQTVNQFRKSFPQQVTSDTLKKLGIAPNNETYIINTLKFIGAIGENGDKTPSATAIFTKHADEDFQKDFAGLIEKAYAELFKLHGVDAWKLSREQLISFFRTTDQTSSIVGQRQASVFQALAGLAGHSEIPSVKISSTPKKKTALTSKPSGPKKSQSEVRNHVAFDSKIPGEKERGNAVGLTVRVEINLPIAPDQKTYDNIFKSIKENLLNG